MKAIGYVRVSTTGQAEQGISLDNQEAKIKSYCELNDLELIEVIKDEGLSAKSLAKRPQAIEMLHKARKEKLAVVVYKLDRMFRNTVESLTTIDSLAKSGASFHSINEKLDTSSAFGKFFLTQIAALAELERNLISERTKDALANKKAQGKRIGNIPFGYTLADDRETLLEFEPEREILRQIQELRSTGLSIRKVTERLNFMGFRSRTGKEFTKPTVKNLVKVASTHTAMR